MKSKEELNALKQEVEALNAKFQELTDEEAAEVFGGISLEEMRRPIFEKSRFVPIPSFAEVRPVGIKDDYDFNDIFIGQIPT